MERRQLGRGGAEVRASPRRVTQTASARPSRADRTPLGRGRYGRADAARRPAPGRAPRRRRAGGARVRRTAATSRGSGGSPRCSSCSPPHPRCSSATRSRSRGSTSFLRARSRSSGLWQLVSLAWSPGTDGARARGRANARVPRARARAPARRVARSRVVARRRPSGRHRRRRGVGARGEAAGRVARRVRHRAARRADRLLERARDPCRARTAAVRRIRHRGSHSACGARPLRRAPLLAASLALTFSRGPWLALAGGSLALSALVARRIGGCASLVLPLVPGLAAAAVAGAVPSRRTALTREDATMAAARAGSGRWRCAAVLVVAAVGRHLGRGTTRGPLDAAGCCPPGVGARSWLAAPWSCSSSASSGSGTPSSVYDAFTAPLRRDQRRPRRPARLGLRQRSRRLLARGPRAKLEANPLLGGGAGSYERWWLPSVRRPSLRATPTTCTSRCSPSSGPSGSRSCSSCSRRPARRARPRARSSSRQRAPPGRVSPPCRARLGLGDPCGDRDCALRWVSSCIARDPRRVAAAAAGAVAHRSGRARAARRRGGSRPCREPAAASAETRSTARTRARRSTRRAGGAIRAVLHGRAPAARGGQVARRRRGGAASVISATRSTRRSGTGDSGTRSRSRNDGGGGDDAVERVVALNPKVQDLAPITPWGRGARRKIRQ